MRLPALLAAIAVAVAVNLAVWALPNRPVSLEDPWQGPLPSVSFAPYRDGQSPLNRSYPSAEQVREDLASLVGSTAAVRTYTSLEGLEVVPGFARELGLKVIQGAWLGNPKYNPDPKGNEREITALIKSANANKDVVTRVIVGNEVLLRRDLPLAELTRYIRQVKRSVSQPVTYADVWEFWIQNPSLAQEVDFITIHVLPYWENEPIGTDRVMAHVDWVYRHVKEAFPDKPVFIGEIGWPSVGRSRADAVPSRVEQAKFLNDVFHWGDRNKVDFNVIEAFDQPWKSALEGTVGAAWGILDVNRRVKTDLTKPIVPQPLWPIFFGLSTVLMLGAFALWRRCLEGLGPWRLIGFGLVAQAAASALAWSALVAYTQTFRLWPEIGAGALVALQAAFALLALGLAARLVGKRTGAPVGVAGTYDALVSAMDPIRPSDDPGGMWRLARRFDLVHLVSALVALGLTAILAINGRYWDFPIPHFLVLAWGPLVLWLLARALDGRETVADLGFGRLWGPAAAARPLRWLDGLIALALAGFAIALVWTERLPPDLADWTWSAILAVPFDGKPWNVEALAWIVCVLFAALPFAVSAVKAPRRG
jgi:exo-beta-1,3-glucanase (GH17 family)